MNIDFRAGAAAAQKVVEAIDKVDGPILAGVGMFVPDALPITSVPSHVLPLIIQDIEKALNDIAQGNDGDIFDTMLEFVNHIRQGKANSPALQARPPTSFPRPYGRPPMIGPIFRWKPKSFFERLNRNHAPPERCARSGDQRNREGYRIGPFV